MLKAHWAFNIRFSTKGGEEMKKLGKKVKSVPNTIEAYACICSCYCSNCNCGYPNGAATSRYYSTDNSRRYSRESSMTR